MAALVTLMVAGCSSTWQRVRGPAQTQSCAIQMDVTKGNVTQHIDHLEERGLMRREKHGRTNSLYLTTAGEELVAEIIPVHDKRVEAVLSLLSESELRDFQTVLRRLDRRLTQK
jgi:MarR family 2-MHQ and catechol resistance regulon transcriptional repressor